MSFFLLILICAFSSCVCVLTFSRVQWHLWDLNSCFFPVNFIFLILYFPFFLFLISDLRFFLLRVCWPSAGFNGIYEICNEGSFLTRTITPGSPSSQNLCSSKTKTTDGLFFYISNAYKYVKFISFGVKSVQL